MKLKNLNNLNLLVGRVFSGVERNIRFKLLSISWTHPLDNSLCFVERDNRTKAGTTTRQTMKVSDFLDLVIRPE